MKFLFMLAVPPLIAACAAYERAEEASKAKSALVGMRKQEVHACAGPPQRRETRGEDEVWIYQSGDDDVRRGPDPDAAGPGGMGIPKGSEVIPERYCVVRITMRDERVADVRYTGMTGGMFSKGEQCAFIVGNCVR